MSVFEPLVQYCNVFVMCDNLSPLKTSRNLVLGILPHSLSLFISFFAKKQERIGCMHHSVHVLSFSRMFVSHITEDCLQIGLRKEMSEHFAYTIF